MSITWRLSSSVSASLALMAVAISMSRSTPSPKPGVSQMVRPPNSYFSMQAVSGSTPTPTLATCILNIALMVELLPLPVAPTSSRLTFSSIRLSTFWVTGSSSPKFSIKLLRRASRLELFCLSMFFYLRICYVVGLYFNHNRQNGQQVSISIILAFLFCLGYYINAKGGVSQC